MVIETIFSAIGILPIFGGITSSVLRMYERPEVECNEVTYTAEENGDIQINATFTATTRYGNPLPITGTICNIRYDFTTEHFIHVRGIVCGEPVKFKPVNIEGGGLASQFDICYIIPGKQLESIIRESPYMNQIQKKIYTLVLEGILERCTPYINMMAYMHESEKNEYKPPTEFPYWQCPLVIQFEFYYPRNRYVFINKRVHRKGGFELPEYVDWGYPMRGYREGYSREE